MSLKRILGVARKLGTPVIITDGEGEEPSVILPLDQFEALASVGSDMNEEVPRAERTRTASEVAPSPRLEAAPKVERERFRTNPAVELPFEPVKKDESLAPEERFYFEPEDDA